MKATLNQLEALYWIARLGSFHRAAGRLNLTQPTISLRVRSLEETLGVRLFERAGRQARLTADAAGLLPQAERILRLAAEFGGREKLDDPLRSHLRLGAPDSFGLLCMPGLLRALKKQNPEMSVTLTIDNSVELGRKLNARELDIAFLVDPKVEPHVRVEPFGIIENVWVASPALRLPAGIVRPEDLAQHEILTNSEPSIPMTMIRGWFADAGVEPRSFCTCNSMSVILRLTIAGAGVSLLPTAILSTVRAGRGLRRLSTRPKIVQPRLFGAYQLDKGGRGARTVLETARRIALRANLVTAV